MLKNKITFRILSFKLFVLLIGLLVTGCATAPITGRSQLMMLSKAEEERLGEAAFLQFSKPLWDKGHIVRRDDPRPEMRGHLLTVNRVFGRILEATGWKDEYKWRFIIVEDSKTVNAGMFPGGKMVLYTGLLNFVKSEDELAAVIGHEIAHAIARHGAERYSQILAANLAIAAVDVAVASSKKYSKYEGAIMIAVGLGAQLGVLLPYSRLHEHEADYIGLLIMSKAGYDPNGAIHFWERMERESKGFQIEYFSTHPSYGTRLTNLKKWLPQASQYREKPWMPLPEKKQ
ncbi:MAG: M48 family metallopeptidase [Desulfobacterota bacterium]|nr:M48 family metallopeptidase [Thermodesulfobacteriota bacterium]